MGSAGGHASCRSFPPAARPAAAAMACGRSARQASEAGLVPCISVPCHLALRHDQWTRRVARGLLTNKTSSRSLAKRLQFAALRLRNRRSKIGAPEALRTAPISMHFEPALPILLMWDNVFPPLTAADVDPRSKMRDGDVGDDSINFFLHVQCTCSSHGRQDSRLGRRQHPIFLPDS